MSEESKVKPKLASRSAGPRGDPARDVGDRQGQQAYVRVDLKRAGERLLQRLTRRQLNEPESGPDRDPGVVIEFAQVAARRAHHDQRPSSRVSMHVPQPSPGTPPAPPPEIPPTPDVIPPDIQDPPPTPHQQPPIVDPMPEPGPPNPVRAGARN